MRGSSKGGAAATAAVTYLHRPWKSGALWKTAYCGVIRPFTGRFRCDNVAGLTHGESVGRRRIVAYSARAVDGWVGSKGQHRLPEDATSVDRRLRDGPAGRPGDLGLRHDLRRPRHLHRDRRHRRRRARRGPDWLCPSHSRSRCRQLGGRSGRPRHRSHRLNSGGRKRQRRPHQHGLRHGLQCDRRKLVAYGNNSTASGANSTAVGNGATASTRPRRRSATAPKPPAKAPAHLATTPPRTSIRPRRASTPMRSAAASRSARAQARQW